MYGRSGLVDRFKKSQTSEPFSISANPQSKPMIQHLSSSPVATPLSGQTQVGSGQSNWHPPDWAIEPRTGLYSLEVVKDGQILDRIHLNRRRNIFGRQHQTCDFVLDHQSISRQHAVVVPHKNGSIFVIDLGSAHGTFVANERLSKDTPVELEVGQSLRFAASTRIYVLRKNIDVPVEIKLPPPPPPDASDEEAVVAYNTLVNRYGLSNVESSCVLGKRKSEAGVVKRVKKMRVSFKDQLGGELAEIVGISDGADIETEPGPIGVKEGGSLVGKYESLVQVTLIPKGKVKEEKAFTGSRGVTDRLQEAIKMLKGGPKRGIYDDLYAGESLAKAVGTSWASSVSEPVVNDDKEETKCGGVSEEDDDNDDLFGD